MNYKFSRKQFVIGSGLSLALVLTVVGLMFFGHESDYSIDTSNRHYAGPFQVSVTVDPDQPRVGNNRLRIDLRDKDGRAVSDATIEGVAVMPAMGSMPVMRAPADIKHVGKGIYRGEFELMMTGAWPLTLDIVSPGKGKASLTFDLTTSRSGLRLASATPGIIAPMANDSGVSEKSVRQDSATTAGKYQIQVSIDPDPPRVGKNTLSIRVTDKNGKPVTGAEVRAAAQMPAMNAAADIQELGEGRYGGKISLAMKGEWSLVVDVGSKALGHGDLTFDMATGRKGLALASATPGGISHYTCSMHPSVKSASPGTCPICGMDLVPVTKKEVTTGSIHMDARRRQLIGVTTGVAEEKNLVQTIRAAGRVTYDETRLTDITLKFNGWIGKLWADSVGAQVRKGRPLFAVYSPELVSAQQEYLETLRRRQDRNDSLLVAARLRLNLWDISPAQIRTLEKQGQPRKDMPILSPVNGTVIEKNIVAGSAVNSDMRLMRIADLSNVWVEGQIYEYEIEHVKQGMDAEVVLPDFGGRRLPAKVAFVYPYLEGDTRTARVRVELDNKDGLLRPDMYAHLHLKIDLGKRLVVPESAVLYAGNSRVVFIDMGDGRLQPRKIKTGVRNNEDIEVLEGLAVGDKVVTSGNFLIAAESKLKAGIDQW